MIGANAPRFKLVEVMLVDGSSHFVMLDTCGHWHITAEDAATVENRLNALSEEFEH